MQSPWIANLLAFWFGELSSKQWFEKDTAVDLLIVERFGGAYVRVASAFQLEQALASPEVALGHVLLLDQLPRNMFRGTARSFESDGKALTLAKEAVARGLDSRIEPARRVFLFLPFEHSEVLADQHRAVELIAALGSPEYSSYAEAHRAIIARFGRFPHRNAILGRTSTTDEIAFLATSGSSF
jgi:uncharacterized protein (DUF924 family)